MDKIRIDKWLWAARFYKTRSLATDEIGKGRVAINDQTAKASREVKVGDMVSTRQGDITRTLKILALSDQRGPAPVAQALYEETPESIALREKTSLQRRLARDRSRRRSSHAGLLPHRHGRCCPGSSVDHG